MIALIVYFVSASSAGTWVAKNVMAPALEALDSLGLWKSGAAESEGPENTDLSGNGEAVQVNLSTDQTAKNSESADITLPGLSCYMLQMGVFSTPQNADTEATSLKTSGAAGYVLEDAGRYRVIAAGYGDEASAKEVKTRLTTEGKDCTVYTLSANDAVFRVTASEDQLEAIKGGFTALSAAQRALTLAALDFDAKALSIDDGRSQAQSILSELRSSMSVLTQYDGTDSMLTGLLTCYSDCENALADLAESTAGTNSAFASQLKHTQLYVTHKYAQFLQSLQV
jgi:hypothetical protein